MSASSDQTAPPPFDQGLADSYVGKVVLVGITYVDHQGRELRRQQRHGVIERAIRGVRHVDKDELRA